MSGIVCCQLVWVLFSLGNAGRLNSYYDDSSLTRRDDFIEIKVGILASGRRCSAYARCNQSGGQS